MTVSKDVAKGLIRLCEELYNAGSDHGTLTLPVPNSDMELEIEVSYHFSMPDDFLDDAED